MISRQSTIGIADVAELVFRALGPRADQRVLVERFAEKLVSRNPISEDRESVQGRLRLVYPEPWGVQVTRPEADSKKDEQTEADSIADPRNPEGLQAT